MEFTAESSFYKYNEQWGWFGWSKEFGGAGGSAYPLAVGGQANLKEDFKAGRTTDPVLTPYYNLGFQGVQPHVDAMAAAAIDNAGYKKYGDYNAQSYLRRYSLIIKSLNYAQWHFDPAGATKEVHFNSDVPGLATAVGEFAERQITDDGSRAITRELTLLDLNTQDLYYKEGPSAGLAGSYGAIDGDSSWNKPSEPIWDPWPQSQRTYGFGQYGGDEDGSLAKRFASPVKGAPARIRRIPIYEKTIKYVGPTGGSAEAYLNPNPTGLTEHQFFDQSSSQPPLWSVDSCGNVVISDAAKDYYSDPESPYTPINLDENILKVIIQSAGGSRECEPCPVDPSFRQVVYKTGYFYTLATAPVIAPGVTGTPSDNGLGWDPHLADESTWAPSSGKGIVIADMGDNCTECIPNIQDVVTQGYAGGTEIVGSGACKTLRLDMGLYNITGNVAGNSGVKLGSADADDEVIDVAESNLWIGMPTGCSFFEAGLRSGDCAIITGNTTYQTGDGQHIIYHESTRLEEFIDVYATVASGYGVACGRVNLDQFYGISGDLPIQPSPEDGTIALNLRNIIGSGGISIFKGEDVYPFNANCDARSYLIISGATGSTSTDSYTGITGDGCCIETSIVDDILYVSGTCAPLTGNWGQYPKETGITSFDQSNLAKDFYNVTGADGTPTCDNYLELYSITGTGCIATSATGNTIYISGTTSITGENLGDGIGLLSGITGDDCEHDFQFRGLSGAGCISTYLSDDETTVYISGTTSITGENLGDGIGLLSGITGDDCEHDFQFRGLSGAGCISTYLSNDETTVYISGTTSITGENLGGGAAVLSGITGDNCAYDFQFRTITGGGDVVVTQEAETITITHHDAATITGTGCCIETVRIGDTIYVSGSCPPLTGNWGQYPKETGITSFEQSNLAKDFYNVTGVGGKSTCENYLELYSITGTGCIATSVTGNTIYISGTTSITGENLGDGIGLLSGITGDDCEHDFQFRGLSGAGCISTYLSDDETTVYISGTTSITGENLGDGIGLLSGITGDDCEHDFQFRGLSGAGCISTYLSDDETTVYISGDTSIEAENVGGGSEVLKSLDVDGCDYGFDFRTIIGGGDIVVDQPGDNVRISYTYVPPVVPEVTGTGCCIETVRIGDTIYVSGSCPPLTGNWGQYPKETGITSFEQSNLAKDFYNVTGVGGKSTCENYLELYSITGTGCIATSVSGNTIYISGTTSITGENLGDGIGLLSGITGDDCEHDFQFRGLSGAGCISTYLSDDETTVYISGETSITGTNVGGGGGEVYASTSQITDCSHDLQFRSIQGIGDVNVYQDASTIYIEHYVPSYTDITGTGCCIETFQIGDTLYVSGTCPSVTGKNIGDGLGLLSGFTGTDCTSHFLLKSLSGVGCISAYSDTYDDSVIYISGATKNFTGNWPTPQETGIDSLNSNQKIDTNLLYGVYDITGEGGAATCEKYLDLVYVTGSGTIGTTIELQEIGDGTFRSTLIITGQEYDLRNQANNFSLNYKEGGSTGVYGEARRFRGWEATGPEIYGSVSGTNLVKETYYVTGQSLTDNEHGHPDSPMWIEGVLVCNGEIYQSPAETGCFEVIDADWVNANGDAGCPSCDIGSFHASPYPLGATGLGWEFVACPPCTIHNTFTEFYSISGTGGISTFSTGDHILWVSGWIPPGGTSCDLLVGPRESMEWRDAEEMILDCLDLEWKTIELCEDGSTVAYDFLVRPT